MDKEQLWRLILARNPGWSSSGADLTPAGVRKLFGLAWDQGYRADMYDQGPDRVDDGEDGKSFFGDLFKDLLGSARKSSP